MTAGTAIIRLRQDYLSLKKDPAPLIEAEPLPTDILQWHYVLRGPPDTPYEDGFYHGQLVFPKEYPFKPPTISMFTPNGRFETNKPLCLSMSSFHPELWRPSWSVSSILIGLLSFMLETGFLNAAIRSSDYEKFVLARKSLEFNLKNNLFCELFPDVVKEIEEKLKSRTSQSEDELMKQKTIQWQSKENPHTPLEILLVTLVILLLVIALCTLIN